MALFKCKMCGGMLEIQEGESVAVCAYCGTKQTLPKLDDDKRANLYDRAGHFRRNNEYDKAAAIYERILNEDNTDAEAYWSLVLCHYGVEYVEDPATHRRFPTINRTQFTSVFDDADYKAALRYADSLQKVVYEEQAKEINEIQKGILAISQKEEPFDIFICYKETDASGRRTPDSVLANDLYHQLTKEGFKVFFSRITLEDKLGTAYEPYIFAALNSAKIMIVLGTRPEYFNAVWVKNEWSRYLTLVKNSGGEKVLIPAYRDMDPYDLPEEFSHLQAQDMGKLGFMQDLIHGIKKIISVDAPKTAEKAPAAVSANHASVAPLLERIFLFLEDGKWKDANTYCERVLDIDPKNAEAYLGKLMAELQVNSRSSLADCAEPFDDRDNFGKIIRFGDETLKEEVRGYITHINDRNENARLKAIYDHADNAMVFASNEAAYREAAEAFQAIPGYQDADSLAEQCLEKAETCRKDTLYDIAKSMMTDDTAASYEEAIQRFQTISGWKDAAEQIYACQKRIEEIKAKEEADRLEAQRKAEERRIAAEKLRKKCKKIIAITTPVLCVCIVFVVVLTTVILPPLKYKAFVENFGQKTVDELASLQDGDTYIFGAYEQDNNLTNGAEAIEWIVLCHDGSALLLISKYALDCQPFHSSNTDVTWESCSLRTWLNHDFLNAAFSAEEQAMIAAKTVSADKNLQYDTNPGSATRDKIFLLSIAEAASYATSKDVARCNPTKYAIAHGAKETTTAGTCRWWLRSPGSLQNKGTYMGWAGNIGRDGYVVNCDWLAVRPAFWIDPKS